MKWRYYIAFYEVKQGGMDWTNEEIRGMTKWEALNHLGSKGWELVQFGEYSNGTTFYFKQPVGD